MSLYGGYFAVNGLDALGLKMRNCCDKDGNRIPYDDETHCCKNGKVTIRLQDGDPTSIYGITSPMGDGVLTRNIYHSMLQIGSIYSNYLATQGSNTNSSRYGMGGSNAIGVDNKEKIVPIEVPDEEKSEATFNSSGNLDNTNQPCKCASLEDIRKCIREIAPVLGLSQGYMGGYNIYNNCGTWVYVLASKCCLNVTLTANGGWTVYYNGSWFNTWHTY